MSSAFFVALEKKHLPKPAEIETLLSKDGYKIKLHADWKPLVDEGFVPIDLEGEEIGCEVHPLTDKDDNPDEELEFSLKRLRAAGFPECDQAFEIVFRSEAELTGAILLSFALASIGQGVVSVDEFGGEVLYSGEQLQPWYLAEFNAPSDGTLDGDDPFGPMEEDPKIVLELCLASICEKAFKKIHHEALRSDIATATAADLGEALYASDLYVEFANGTTIGGQSWSLKNDSGLSLSAMSATRYALAPAKTRKQIVRQREKSGHPDPQAFDQYDPLKSDHLALIEAVGAMKNWDETVTLATFTYIEPNWIKLHFSDAQNTVLAFLCTGEGAEISVKSQLANLTVRHRSVVLEH